MQPWEIEYTVAEHHERLMALEQEVFSTQRSPLRMSWRDVIFVVAVVFAAAFVGSTIGYMVGRWLA